MSLFHSFRSREFCSPLFGFLRFVPGFVEVDQIPNRLLRMRVLVTGFEASTDPMRLSCLDLLGPSNRKFGHIREEDGMKTITTGHLELSSARTMTLFL